jgi:hypothetical protein
VTPGVRSRPSAAGAGARPPNAPAPAAGTATTPIGATLVGSTTTGPTTIVTDITTTKKTH